MLLRRLFPLLLLLTLTLAVPARGQDSVIEDPAFQAAAERGLDHLYNMEFAEAEAIFDRLAARHPEHPAGPFLQALVPWWRILMDLADTRHDAAFFDAMDEVIERSNRRLRRDHDDLDARFFKGAALGFRGRLEANRRRWLKAAQNGLKAMDHVIEVADSDPSNADFLFGRGIYDYYAAATPERYPWSRPFVAMFPDGSKARGLAALHRTFREGSYLQAEAAYFLLQIYYLYEREETKARQFISWLRNEYPDNAFFHTMEGRLLARFGDWNASADVFREVLRRRSEGRTGYNEATAEQALYYLARREFSRGNYNQALRQLGQLERIAAGREIPSAFQTLGRLRQGMAHDARSERDAARRRYRETLRLRDISGAHDRARRYLERPFRG